MTRGPGSGSEPPQRGSSSDLPAEYVDPWRRLGRDLVALAAWSRLRWRELVRRNGEGDLWRPPFWPESLAAWFWPLALAASLALLTLLPLALGRPGASGAVAEPPAPDAVPSPAAPELRDAAKPADRPTGRPQASLAPEPVAPEPVAPETVAPGPAAPEPPAPDPLLLALEEEPATALLLAAEPLPGRRLLRLTVGEAFLGLAPPDRQARASRWWQRGQELGYELLELRDGRGRLLGRTALVGDGVLLFAAEDQA